MPGLLPLSICHFVHSPFSDGTVLVFGIVIYPLATVSSHFHYSDFLMRKAAS